VHGVEVEADPLVIAQALGHWAPEPVPAAARRRPLCLRETAAWHNLGGCYRPLLGGRWRLSGTFVKARMLKQSLELPLHGAWDMAKPLFMKGKVSSGAGIYWPIIPKWGDRQTCLIT
jgi:hypothetical protein